MAAGEMAVFVAAASVVGFALLARGLGPLLRHRARQGAGLIVGAALSVTALYALVGTPRALDPDARTPPKTLAGAVTRLEQELARNPAQGEGWRLLAEGYRAQGRTREAAGAYEQALRHGPRTPDALAQAAEARAQAAPDRRFDARSVGMLEEALRLEPQHERSRWFLGVAMRQAGRPADAARAWEPLLQRVQPSTAAALLPQIQAARRDAGLPALPEPSTATRTIEVSIDIDPGVRARMRPDAVVFVIARVPGQRMPVAVERMLLSSLPTSVTLDDGDGPMPTARLSELAEAEVTARVSADGTANARPADAAAPVMRVPVGGSTRLLLR